jgi:hypothetical protein
MARTQNQSAGRDPAQERPSTAALQPRQEVEGSKFTDGITQKSDQERTQQRVASSSGKKLDQTITSKLTELSAFGVRGRGLVAVLAACVVVLAYLALKYLH